MDKVKQEKLMKDLLHKYFSYKDEFDRLTVVSEMWKKCDRAYLMDLAQEYINRREIEWIYLGVWLLSRGEDVPRENKQCLSIFTSLLKKSWRSKDLKDRLIRSIGQLPLPNAEKLLLSLFDELFKGHEVAFAESIAIARTAPNALTWSCLKRITECKDIFVKEFGLWGIYTRLSSFPASALPEEIKKIVLKNVKYPDVRIKTEAIRCLLYIDASAAKTALIHEVNKYGVDSRLMEILDEVMDVRAVSCPE